MGTSAGVAELGLEVRVVQACRAGLVVQEALAGRVDTRNPAAGWEWASESGREWASEWEWVSRSHKICSRNT